MEKVPGAYQFIPEFKKALRNMIGWFFISLYLAPLVAGAAIATEGFSSSTSSGAHS